MDGDGTLAGYDLSFTRLVADAVDLPVIASGGGGKPGALHPGSGSQACIKLPGDLQEFPILPDRQHAAEPISQEPDIFHDDGTCLDFHDTLGGKIAKDIFDIPRVTYTAGDGKP
jgi:hypothetical protein